VVARRRLLVSDNSRGCEPRQGRDRGRSPLGAEAGRVVDPSAEFAQQRSAAGCVRSSVAARAVPVVWQAIRFPATG
jgi:hypothetical protein